MRIRERMYGPMISKHPSRKRRYLISLSILVAVTVIIAIWINYDVFSANEKLPQPVSDISSTPPRMSHGESRQQNFREIFNSTHQVNSEDRIRWRFNTSTPLRSAPVASGDRLYLGTGDGRILALNSKSGSLIWERNIGVPINASPTVAGNLVFIGGLDGIVHAVDVHTGAPIWEFVTDGLIYSAPIVIDGELYVGSTDRRLHVLDAMTGEMRWSYLTDGWITTTPAIHEGVAAITSYDSKLYILDVSTGELIMDYNTTSAGGTPVFDGAHVIVSDSGGAVSSVIWSEGDKIFEDFVRRVKIQLYLWGLIDTLPYEAGHAWGVRQRGASFVGTPIVTKNNVYVASTGGHVFAFDKNNGTMVWDVTLNESITGSLTIVGKTVLVGDLSGNLHALDEFTGEKLWGLSVGGPISSPPVFADDLIFLSSLDGTLYALDPLSE